MEEQSLNSQSRPGESSLLSVVSKSLAKISGLKGISISKETYRVWHDQISHDLNAGLIKDLEAGFHALSTKQSFGGLDYAIFFAGAKTVKENSSEVEWQECLASSRCGGEGKISARSAKVLNSFGGMMWLRNSDRDKAEWYRKEFMRIYETMPAPADKEFRCYGQNMDLVYLGLTVTKAIESKDRQDQKLLASNKGP